MTWCDQIEVRTNAADMSTVWKHLKRSEKNDIITSRVIYESAVVNKKKHFARLAGFHQNKSWEKATTPSTSLNVSIVILLFFKIQ